MWNFLFDDTFIFQRRGTSMISTPSFDWSRQGPSQHSISTLDQCRMLRGSLSTRKFGKMNRYPHFGKIVAFFWTWVSWSNVGNGESVLGTSFAGTSKRVLLRPASWSMVSFVASVCLSQNEPGTTYVVVSQHICRGRGDDHLLFACTISCVAPTLSVVSFRAPSRFCFRLGFDKPVNPFHKRESATCPPTLLVALSALINTSRHFGARRPRSSTRCRLTSASARFRYDRVNHRPCFFASGVLPCFAVACNLRRRDKTCELQNHEPRATAYP